MLLVGFSFGAFLEGAAGFGAPVAITAALLVGLGFSPLYAAGLCLIVNTAPVAFGAMGIPIIVAGQVTGIDAFEIGQMAGRQLPFLCRSCCSGSWPSWTAGAASRKPGRRCWWPASFAVAVLTSNFIGPELPDITSSLVSLVCLTVFLKRWKPAHIFRFAPEPGEAAPPLCRPMPATATPGQILKAWSPFLILTVMVTIWSIKPFKALFAKDGPLAGWVLSFRCRTCTSWCRRCRRSCARPRPTTRCTSSTGSRPPAPRS
jgi:L-lactate permease